VLGQRLLLDVIGAAVIGGTSLFGGRGRIVWTLYGALFLTLIDNTLNLAGYSHFAIMMVKGGIILLAALLDVMRTKLR
jgi:ribose transport system permease protein